MTAIFCAIDLPDLDGALDLCRSLMGVVDGFKLGLEFFTVNGSGGVRKVVALGQPVFLDLKYHDISNTVAGAVRAAGTLGVAMLTLHVVGGHEMLRAAVDAAQDCALRTELLGVTVLTSVDDADLAIVGVPHRASDQVLRLAELAQTSGLDGVICAPQEIAALRRRFGADFRLVVPGIRPAGSGQDDHKRTLGPAEAAAAGADWLVIGRPITTARDPRRAALSIAAEIRA